MGEVVSIIRQVPACPNKEILTSLLENILKGGWGVLEWFTTEFDISCGYWQVKVPVIGHAGRKEIMAFWYNGDNYIQSCTTEENKLLTFTPGKVYRGE